MTFKINSLTSLISLAFVVLPSWAYAGCSNSGFCGRIIYLGKTVDSKQAVFLSATKTPGKYDVSTTAAFDPHGGGDLPVDTWSKSRPGLRLTVSNYPEDWGGTHILYAYPGENSQLHSRQFVASANQNPGGIVFPPNFKPPVIKPPTRPPVEGITPELPMGVKPPIGTLPAKPPVTGVMPELPMGVKPPIGTLPAKPPVTGVMPGLPMGVKPPIGTLPAKPPVTGVMPELPMGVKPPIGTLPAKPPVTGITPELPAGVKPPIGTLPPEPPTGSEIVAATALPASRELAVLTPCPMQQDPATIVDKNALTDVNCMGMQLEGNNSSNLTAIPSTEGREFGLETLWNTWADSNYVDIRDRRHDMDLSGHSASVALGFDRRLDSGLIAGMSLSLENNKSSAFANDMRNSSNGFNIGPYIAYPYSENWVFDGSLTFSHMNNQQHLLILDGDYSSQRYAISARANGQFPLGEALIRPKIGVYYAHNRSEAYALNGMIAGYALRLENEKSSVNTGSIDSAIEITQTFYTQNGTPWMPYAELLLGYEFARVNDGKILTGDLSLLDSSPWQGGVKVGVRSLLGRSSSIDASAGYLSLGQKDLNIWELRLFLSHAF